MAAKFTKAIRINGTFWGMHGQHRDARIEYHRLVKFPMTVMGIIVTPDISDYDYRLQSIKLAGTWLDLHPRASLAIQNEFVYRNITR